MSQEVDLGAMVVSCAGVIVPAGAGGAGGAGGAEGAAGAGAAEVKERMDSASAGVRVVRYILLFGGRWLIRSWWMWMWG